VSTPERRGALVVAELALVAVSLAVVAGFGRVFQDGYLVPLGSVVLAAHLTSALARRRGWGLPSAAALTAAVGALVATWTILPDTTALGLPTLATLDGGATALDEGWTAFRDVIAPAPPLPGLLLASAAALVFGAFLADWAAFRLWSPFEALVAPFSVFVFCSLLGADRQQVASASGFAATAVAYLLAHRVAAREGTWHGTGARPARRALVAVGSVVGVLAVVVGVLAGPRLPGATEEAVVDWRAEQDRNDQRVTISPLVDIRSRLVDRSDIEVFTVEATERAYWRLTSLDTFEDGVWKSSGRYSAVDGSLPGTSPAPTATEIDQVVTIEALAALWLPAAFEPVAVDAARDVRWNEASATLIVDTDLATSDGLAYTVRSARPDLDAEELRSAPTDVPDGIAETYLPLGDDDRALVGALAEEVTAGAGSDYDRALALQDWFRAEFTYDLEVPPGHGEDAIAAFLDVRRGYCEQFAGTYAVMARALGLPARVAVGFTPGEPDAEDPDLYRVRGEHAHAWPEVWLAGRWVPFEPTPGRGAPGADHTGVPEAQDTSGPAVSPTTATTGTTVAPGGADPATTATTTPAGATPTLDAGAGADAADDGPPLPVVVGLLALAAGIAYLAVTPVVLAARRRRRRQRATAPAARVALAWEEALEDLAAAGTSHRSDETNREFAERAGHRFGPQASALASLAERTDAAVFGVGTTTREHAQAAESEARAIAVAVDERLDRVGRIRRRLDPRHLVGTPGSRHRVGR
jgi:transglutaminase-like putative cysteine protease